MATDDIGLTLRSGADEDGDTFESDYDGQVLHHEADNSYCMWVSVSVSRSRIRDGAGRVNKKNCDFRGAAQS